MSFSTQYQVWSMKIEELCLFVLENQANNKEEGGSNTYELSASTITSCM